MTTLQHTSSDIAIISKQTHNITCWIERIDPSAGQPISIQPDRLPFSIHWHTMQTLQTISVIHHITPCQRSFARTIRKSIPRATDSLCHLQSDKQKVQPNHTFYATIYTQQTSTAFQTGPLSSLCLNWPWHSLGISHMEIQKHKCHKLSTPALTKIVYSLCTLLAQTPTSVHRATGIYLYPLQPRRMQQSTFSAILLSPQGNHIMIYPWALWLHTPPRQQAP